MYWCNIKTIDKQNALRRDYIYNIENMDLEIGVSGVYYNILTHIDVQPDLLILRVTLQLIEIE